MKEPQFWYTPTPAALGCCGIWFILAMLLFFVFGALWFGINFTLDGHDHWFRLGRW